MKTRDELLAYLDAIGVEHRTHDHPAVFSVAESGKMKQEIPGAHTKNLFLKDAKDQLWLVSAESHAEINLKRLHTVIGAARLSFGRAELMEETLGVTPGSVTAFGLVNDTARRVRFVLDSSLADADFVNFHPLTNTATTTISRGDFRKFLTSVGVAAMVVDFAAMAIVEA